MSPVPFVLRRELVMAVMTLLVEVAVPAMVRPPAAEPLPIVVDALEMMPPVNESSVDVLLLGNK